MVDLVSNFLRELNESEIEPAVRLIIGIPLTRTDSRTLDVSFVTIMKSMKKHTNASDDHILQVFNKFGDIGTSIRTLLDEAQR